MTEPHKRQTMIFWFIGKNGLRVGWRVLVFILTVALLLYLLLLVPLPLNLVPLPLNPLHRQDIPSESLVLIEGELLLAIAGSTALMALIERRSIWSYGLGDRRPIRRFLLGGFSGLLLPSLLVGCLVLTGHLTIEGRLLGGRDIANYGLISAAGYLILAIAEEMQFRGYLQVTLARVLGFWPAAILLSLAFGLAHLGNSGENALGIVNTVLFGIVLSLCLRLSGSLWWGIGFHAAWDWSLSFIYGAPVSGLLIQPRMLQYHAAGDAFWTGGSAGPEASALTVPVLCATTALVAWTFGHLAALLEAVRSR